MFRLDTKQKAPFIRKKDVDLLASVNVVSLQPYNSLFGKEVTRNISITGQVNIIFDDIPSRLWKATIPSCLFDIQA